MHGDTGYAYGMWIVAAFNVSIFLFWYNNRLELQYRGRLD